MPFLSVAAPVFPPPPLPVALLSSLAAFPPTVCQRERQLLPPVVDRHRVCARAGTGPLAKGPFRIDLEAQRAAQGIALGLLHSADFFDTFLLCEGGGVVGVCRGGCIWFGPPGKILAFLPAANGCGGRYQYLAEQTEDGVRLTGHKRVAKVVLAVLVRLDIGPFEVGAAAAGRTSVSCIYEQSMRQLTDFLLSAPLLQGPSW